MKKTSALFLVLFACFTYIQAQINLYFPPKTGNQWEQLPPAAVGFCPERIDSLYAFLEGKNTKSFLLLKDGKIVLEKYFGTFTQDSVWYWASAGKSLSAFLVGIARESHNLDIQAPTSQYLQSGWTSCPADKELLITVRDQLRMTSGLDDNLLPPPPGVTDVDNCTEPQCLVYKANAGTRWAYHNAPYHLVHDVIEGASNLTLNQFTNTKLSTHTGIAGLWVNHIFYSKARSMARFGLLMLADGRWQNDTLIHDLAYVQAMRTPSQTLNQSYGYLWWLNGQSSFMLPSVQIVFPGSLVPSAPADMYSALGKNDQKIHVVPSKGWVVVRQGEDAGYNTPGGGSVPIAFDKEMWDYLNLLECTSAAHEAEAQPGVVVSPNPASEAWYIHFGEGKGPFLYNLYDAQGVLVRAGESADSQMVVKAEGLASGVYVMRWRDSEQQKSGVVTLLKK